MDTAHATGQACLDALDARLDNALKTIQPQPPLPANIGAAGSNLSGIEVIDRKGVPYVNYLVPDFVVNSLNKLNGLGNILKPALEQSSKQISDGRFSIAKAFNSIAKQLDFAFSRNSQMASEFKATSDYVLNKMQQPIGDMRSFITNLVKLAVPLLSSAPPSQAKAVFVGTIPVFQAGIQSATNCITKMTEHTVNGIQSGYSTALQTYNSVSQDVPRTLVVQPYYGQVRLLSVN